MPVAPPDVSHGWTLADLDQLPDDACRYELVDGGLVVTPPPTQHHQELAYDLHEHLRQAAPPGWRVRVEYPLPFSQDTQRVPDVVVFRWPLQHPREDHRSPLGPADVGMVVEVVSPHSRRTDRFAKPGEYADARIPIYWRLETEPELVLHAFVLRGTTYAPVEPGRLPAPWGDVVLELATLGR